MAKHLVGKATISPGIGRGDVNLLPESGYYITRKDV